MTQPTPSYVYAQVNGRQVATREEWQLGGKLHRVDGPACKQWEIVNGLPVLTYEGWVLEGKFRRVDGPAWREWQIVNGGAIQQQILAYEGWYLNNRILDPLLLPATALTLQRWYRRYRRKRWRFINSHLRAAGLIVFPGLIPLLQSY